MPVELKADNPLLISTAGRDKTQHAICPTSNCVTADVSSSFFQTSTNQSECMNVFNFREACECYHSR